MVERYHANFHVSTFHNIQFKYRPAATARDGLAQPSPACGQEARLRATGWRADERPGKPGTDARWSGFSARFVFCRESIVHRIWTDECGSARSRDAIPKSRDQPNASRPSVASISTMRPACTA